jgi:cardiolipin synthase
LKRSTDGKNEDKTPWRDTHLLVEGPVVADFQKLFMESWTKQKGDALPARKYFPAQQPKGKEVVRAVGSSSDDGGGQMYSTLISAINSAETSVYLTNAYFAPDEHIMRALIDAVGRRVDVKIILPSKTDSAMIFYAGRSYYSDLLNAGIKIYERGEVLLHAKTALIDGVWSTIGSTNLDWRSFLHNDEVNAIVLSPEFGAQMNAMFEKDLASSRQITVASWRDRSLVVRVKEQAARMWVYWL